MIVVSCLSPVTLRPFTDSTWSPAFSFPSAGPPLVTSEIFTAVLNGMSRARSAAATALSFEDTICALDSSRTLSCVAVFG